MSPQDLLQLEVEKVYLAGAEYVRGKRLGRTLLDGLKNRSRLV
jgi:hypothetical protein